MAKMKTIYFDDELLSQIGETKNFSERVKELVAKGLQLEQKGNELSMSQLLETFVKKYNVKTNKPVYILPN